MLVTTERFGSLQIGEQDIVTFALPILGFQKQRRFCFFESSEDKTFLWLQSIDYPGVAFPLIDPTITINPFEVRLHGADWVRLGTTSYRDIGVVAFVIVNLAHEPQAVTANFKAPILIHRKNKLAIQVILEKSVYEVDTPIFKALCKAEKSVDQKQRDVVLGKDTYASTNVVVVPAVTPLSGRRGEPRSIH